MCKMPANLVLREYADMETKMQSADFDMPKMYEGAKKGHMQIWNKFAGTVFSLNYLSSQLMIENLYILTRPNVHVRGTEYY